METRLLIGIIIIVIIIIIVLVAAAYFLMGGEEPQQEMAEESAQTSAQTTAQTQAETTGTTWKFYPYMDSNGGDDRTISSGARKYANNPMALIKIANEHPNIVAFNTNGWMKTTLRPQNQWRKWTNDPNKGLYVKI